MKPLTFLKNALKVFAPLALALSFSSYAFGEGMAAAPTLVPQYVHHLNAYYPDLNLKAFSQGQKAYHELELLEGILNPTLEDLRKSGGQTPWLPDGSLIELSCSKTVCGNGGGPCRTCLVGYDSWENSQE
jgi:hypothetical protein